MRMIKGTGLAVLPLLLGLLFLAASLTPSLIPREWLVQGVLGGLVMALGYLIGRIIMGLWWVMELPTLQERAALIFYAILTLPVIVVVIICLGKADDWQNGIRSRMGMDTVDSSETIRMLLVAAVVFAVLVLVGALLRVAFDYLRHRLYRFMPARTANIAGFLLTVFIVVVVTRDGVLDKVIANLDKSVTVAQHLFDTAPPAPSGAGIAGGKSSLIAWGAMGQPGRDYVTTGPSAAAISQFTGREALQPIRVYAGLAQAETPQERADIALAELKRLGGFDRKVLIVALPTGTGWLDPGAVDTVEYMHGGDIATIAVQYSYLQSPLALILETRSGLDQARELISTVHSYWKTLPRRTRPKLYIHGLSLGAWASMHGTGLFALLDDPINGALWAGPPFPSAMWNGINAERTPDSPYVRPTIGDGQLVRFASHTNDAGGPAGWGDMRLVFLQYSSDPIVFYEAASVFRAPEWMREPAAVDVSPDMIFIPIVTQFQLAVDMALANSAPDGHGHAYYGPDYVRPWVAVTDPDNWTDADSTRLAAHCDGGFHQGCRN
ncbi:putative membrane protein [Litoreibacter halocynthiae]|uniref:Putative membrane protein n=2 Tax=Litoreibacter halocynthiae TaxID=1242689 RepID=A0A4R7LQ89_9RHOB|nr:putative membrane protein [Litoreibacter halocynthiae]